MKLSADEGNLMEDTTMYRRIVGSLIYMTITRPDLSYAIGVVSEFMQTPRNTTKIFGFCNCHLQLKFSCMLQMQLQICVVA